MFEMLEYILQWYHLLKAKVYTEYRPPHFFLLMKIREDSRLPHQNRPPPQPYFRKETNIVKPF